MGTGTLLDTARFRALLGRYYGVDPRSVHAYILGEHGDTEVPIWSNAMIGGQPIKGRDVLGQTWDRDEMQSIFEEARNAAYEIIDKKGHTDSAIGVVIARIVRAILEDQENVLPVSVRQEGNYGIRNVCLSTPCVVGSDGVEKHVVPDLSEEEGKALRESAEALRENQSSLDLEL